MDINYPRRASDSGGADFQEVAPMRYDGLDLNLLVALDALLTERSVSGAAARLHRSQPATSAALNRLRDYFNDELLVVEGRRMRPTLRGEQLVEPVRHILAQIESTVVSPPVFDPATCMRRFTIEASDYVSEVLLADVFDDVMSRAPGVTLHVMARADGVSTEPSLADLVIAPDVFPAPGQTAARLFSDDFVVVGWKDNPAMQTRMTQESFLELDHVAVAFGRSRYVSFPDAALASLAAARRIVLFVPRFTGVCSFIAGSQRVAVMHRHLAHKMAELWPLSLAEVPFRIPAFREVILHRPDREGDEGLMWLRSVILRHASRLPQPNRKGATRRRPGELSADV
ncbi:LysR family transcriptional regulator [Luteibacter sp. ME-Dv--P-043b]|uniref:LysR family transcriptional regulator n=1 Tax=Luteibacter sp. ME-Dv--P-043b TaxID=3040291 RepID=UPI0025541C65|nr:LysR family transcriptional regulator [Luteibacter sp. ME-Dv--P-043b]